MKVYKIEIFNYTVKNKINYIDRLFIQTDADIKNVEKHYRSRFKPLNISVDEIEVVEIPSKKDKEKITETYSGSMYNTASYRISKDILPKNIISKLDDISELEEQINSLTKELNINLGEYLNTASFTSQNSDSIRVSGFLKPLKLQLPKKEKTTKADLEEKE